MFNQHVFGPSTKGLRHFKQMVSDFCVRKKNRLGGENSFQMPNRFTDGDWSLLNGGGYFLPITYLYQRLNYSYSNSNIQKKRLLSNQILLNLS